MKRFIEQPAASLRKNSCRTLRPAARRCRCCCVRWKCCATCAWRRPPGHCNTPRRPRRTSSCAHVARRPAYTRADRSEEAQTDLPVQDRAAARGNCSATHTFEISGIPRQPRRAATVVPHYTCVRHLWCRALGAGGNVAWAPDASVASAERPIPRDHYKSWSLFLICSAEWARPQGAEQLEALYRQFLSFGEAIGQDHWLCGSRKPARREAVHRHRSTSCAARLRENLKLPPGEGPYVLLTSRYPGSAMSG